MGMAMTIGQKTYENMAVDRAKDATQSAIDAQRRQAQRLGVNPNSGRYLSMEKNAQYDAAAQIGAAGTQASSDWLRQAQQQQNMSMQYDLQNRGMDLRQQDINNNFYWNSRSYKMQKDREDAYWEAQDIAERERLGLPQKNEHFNSIFRKRTTIDRSEYLKKYENERRKALGLPLVDTNANPNT